MKTIESNKLCYYYQNLNNNMVYKVENGEMLIWNNILKQWTECWNTYEDLINNRSNWEYINEGTMRMLTK